MNIKLSPKLITALFVLTVAVILWTQAYSFLGNSFSQDSYSYYLLGKNLWSGKGYTTDAVNDLFARAVFPNPSRSFPPVFPVLIGLVDHFTSLKIQSGIYLNLLVGVLTAWVFSIFCKVFEPQRWKLLLAVFPVFLLTNMDYLQEIAAGRAIPLVFLFYLLLNIFFVKGLKTGTVEWWSPVAMGLLLCLMTLTRFDQMIFAFGFPFAAFLIYWAMGVQPKRAAQVAAVIWVSFGVFYSPWAIRNYQEFGVLFASHNSITAKSTVPGSLHLFFWKEGNGPLTLAQAPGLWLAQRAGYFLRNLANLLRSTRYLLLLNPILLGVFYKKLSKRELIFSALAGAYGIATLISVSTTSYVDSRYFSLLILLMFVLFLMIVSGPVVKMVPKAGAVVTAGLAAYILYFAVAPFEEVYQRGMALIPQANNHPEFFYGRVAGDLADMTHGRDAVIAIDGADAFTYYSGFKSLFPPRNASKWDENMQAWYDKWKPDYLIAPKVEVAALGLEELPAHETIGGLKIVDLQSKGAKR